MAKIRAKVREYRNNNKPLGVLEGCIKHNKVLNEMLSEDIEP